MTDNHKTIATKEYVRLSFTPIGGKRRTVWAQVGKAGARARMFFLVDKYGDEPRDRRELIIVAADGSDSVVRPARWNLHYGELELDAPAKKGA